MTVGAFSLISILDLLAWLGLSAFAVFGLGVPLFEVFRNLLSSPSGIFAPDVLAAAKITFLQASVSSIFATFLGVGVALSLPRTSRWAKMLLGAPFGVPAVVAATAWTLLLPRALSFSLTAVTIAHVFFNAPWVALWVGRALDEVSVEQTEASSTLGASRWNTFRYVVLPAILPDISSVFTQVFSFCAMSFILVMILGGGPSVDTLETTLFSKIRAGGLDLSGACACAFWQIALTVLPWVFFRNRKKTRLERGRSSRKARSSTSAMTWVGALLAVAFVLPYSVLLWRIDLMHLLRDSAIFSEVIASVRISALLSFGTAIWAVLISLLGVWAESRSRFFSVLGSFLLVLPSGISVMVLGLGFFLAFSKWLDPFSPSLWPIIFLQAVFFVPVAYRVFSPIGQRRDRSAWDAALTLGASPLKVFRFVEWPRWKGAVSGVFFLIMGSALGEVAAVSLFYNEDRIPSSLLISRWMGQYRFEDAQALSAALMLVSALLIAAGFWWSHEVDHVAR